MKNTYIPTKRLAKSQLSKPSVNDTYNNIMGILKSKGSEGITGGWIGSRLNLPNSTISARVNELEAQGKVLRLERRAPNPSGASANIIISSEFKPAVGDVDKVLEKPTQINTPSNIEVNRTLYSDVSLLLNDLNDALSEGRFIAPESFPGTAR